MGGGGARLSLLVTLLIVSVVRPPAVRWPGRHIGAVVAAGLADTLGTVLFAYAARQASLGVVAVLGSLYPVVTVLLGRLLLTERLTPIQHTGVGLALGGICLACRWVGETAATWTRSGQRAGRKGHR